jgi:hypothetical protein
LILDMRDGESRGSVRVYPMSRRIDIGKVSASSGNRRSPRARVECTCNLLMCFPHAVTMPKKRLAVLPAARGMLEPWSPERLFLRQQKRRRLTAPPTTSVCSYGPSVTSPSTSRLSLASLTFLHVDPRVDSRSCCCPPWLLAQRCGTRLSQPFQTSFAVMLCCRLPL